MTLANFPPTHPAEGGFPYFKILDRPTLGRCTGMESL